MAGAIRLVCCVVERNCNHSLRLRKCFPEDYVISPCESLATTWNPVIRFYTLSFFINKDNSESWFIFEDIPLDETQISTVHATTVKRLPGSLFKVGYPFTFQLDAANLIRRPHSNFMAI